MPFIHILDESTINQIAAGEVVERPSAVVKELVENAMDAGATAITVEIKEGGLSFIRITDNGAGIAKEDIPLAFLRHATSKIRTAQDLLSVTSLGFRGEALSSVASVAQVELITKTPSALNGYRYIIEGGDEKSLDEIGCPGGTTIIVRNLFYNTPARRNFLKSAMTEAGYISDLMERLMISHPNISFKFIMNNQLKLQSSGNHNRKDILYQVYGRDITKELLPLEAEKESLKLTGFIGKPVINRGNRNFENYFINGRYIKSSVITKAIEEAYKPYLMQHKYPFTSIYFEIDPAMIDVNIHPQKLEIRLKNGEEVYQFVYHALQATLSGKEMIPSVSLTKLEEKKEQVVSQPEPFEQNRRNQFFGMERQQSSQPTKSIPMTYNSVAGNETRKVAEQDKNYSVHTDKENTSDHRKEFGRINTSSASTTSGRANSPEASLKTLEILAEVMSSPQKEGSFDIAGQGITLKENEVISKESMQSLGNNNLISEVDNLPREGNNIISGISKLPQGMTEVSSEGNKPPIEASNIIQDENKLLSESSNIIIDKQMELFTTSDDSEEQAPFLSKKALEEHRIIGQIFATYWLVEYKKELYIIDQHAAHEKVLYERIISGIKEKAHLSQQLLPPIVLTLTLREQEILQKQKEVLESIGYEIEHFGGNEFSVRAVPADLYGLSEKSLLLEFIDQMVEDFSGGALGANSILERVASIACKAAVKANYTLSYEEAAALIKELLTLDNPYHCPHGRPVIISMSQYELERKFKRIV